MAITGKLAAEPRTKLGSLHCRRLRLNGQVPGNLYGHKEAPVPLSVSADDVARILKLGTRVLDVELNGKSEKALLREVQWDYLGTSVEHVDLMRVDPNERLTIEVHVELKGVAPGVMAGGVLDHALRTVTIECPVVQIPDNIAVKVTSMEIGHVIHVRELELPPNTRILNNPEIVVVRIAKAVEMPLVAAGEGAVQPEVIGRKAEEEEAE